MVEFFSTLQSYFSVELVRNAFIVSVFISVAASLLGVTLVLKRFSFIGDGLSHTAFGAMAIATVLRLTNSNLFVMPVTILCAVILLRMNNSKKVKGDASLAVISVTSMALGYFLMNICNVKANVSGDVCSTLFGSTAILTLTPSDVWLCIGSSILVVLVYIFYYHNIFAVTFDEEFAKASGINVNLYNTMIAVISAVVIVLAMNLVGSLLISALVIFPALSSMRLFRSFKSVTICSAVISVFCAVSGLVISILAETPVGSTIVAADLVVFLLFCLIGKFRK